MNLLNIFMAVKKKVIDQVEESTEVSTLKCIVNDQNGNEVQVFNNVEEAYKFASENGYSVNISN